MFDSNETSVFHKNSYEEFLKKLNNKEFTAFSNFKNDFDRFEFLNKLPNVLEYKIDISNSNKSLPEAKLLKERGNSAFQSGDNKMALNLYTKSLMKSPFEKDKEVLSIIRANRSAALYHLKEYSLALVDIEAAISSGYPKNMIYKLKNRKAQCLMALNQNKAGLDALQETLSALDDAKLPLEQRLKRQKDVQIMIALMTKNKVIDEKLPKKDKMQIKADFKRNKTFTSASEAIEVKYTEESGRFAEAKRDIRVGEIIVTEEAHCAVLLENKTETHCFQCMIRVVSGEPCPTCDRVKFCSINCQEAAIRSHHKFECKILQSLWQSGLSITCLMALRIISQRNPHYFMKLLQKLKEDNRLNWNSKKYTGMDYLTVNSLVTHEEERTPAAMMQKAFIAVYLFQCLKEASYFEGILKHETEEGFKLIGGLILRNLQLLQFNAHEVSELECPTVDLNTSKSTFIGGGLYPTLALFNHSCNPSLVRYFDGSKIIARAIRPIQAGEMVAENYGPIFTEMEISLRKKQLKQNYWFDCNCEACAEKWPLLKHMDPNSLRFRCENKRCSNVIVVLSTTMEFMVKCSKCSQLTNLLKGLKALQDSENLFRLALGYLKSGEPENALKKYTELLELLHENLAPPFKDYHLCQQGLRTCYLSYGNMWKLYE